MLIGKFSLKFRRFLLNVLNLLCHNLGKNSINFECSLGGWERWQAADKNYLKLGILVDETTEQLIWIHLRKKEGNIKGEKKEKEEKRKTLNSTLEPQSLNLCASLNQRIAGSLPPQFPCLFLHAIYSLRKSCSTEKCWLGNFQDLFFQNAFCTAFSELHAAYRAYADFQRCW